MLVAKDGHWQIYSRGKSVAFWTSRDHKYVTGIAFLNALSLIQQCADFVDAQKAEQSDQFLACGIWGHVALVKWACVKSGLSGTRVYSVASLNIL